MQLNPKTTTKTLKALLTSIGSQTTGTKPILRERLSRDLRVSRLPGLFASSPTPISTSNSLKKGELRGSRLRGKREEREDGNGKEKHEEGLVELVEKGKRGDRKSEKKGVRILSVDLGIRNLAFCVMDVSIADPVIQKNGKKEGSNSNSTSMNINVFVRAWRRLDVAQEILSLSSSSSPSPEIELQPEDPYNPSILSHTAHTLLTRTLLPHDPDIILLERQRWRSGGGPAIQQWTVRVNLFEGMLWAVLATLKKEKRWVGDVESVEPKRVGGFWVGGAGAGVGEPGPARKGTKKGARMDAGSVGNLSASECETSSKSKLPKNKAEKRAKIALLRSWLSASPPTASTTSIFPTTDSTTPLNVSTTQVF
ncbi:ribonuclease H-like protein, partial [Sporormia fimetaria CBS 119925]